ncbi:MAG: aspartyl/asparaginyl beta-hydroxylase domain-containing protein [Gammaproteobacteria bacterium]|nr:aspartyl/asparaginyl beta-hydroxylase domain-containing protein [Gammaproteobacteria bacterium]
MAKKTRKGKRRRVASSSKPARSTDASPAAVEARLARHRADTPQSAEAAYEHGVALTQLGKLEEALEAMQSAMRLDVATLAYPLQVGMLCRALGRMDDAARAFQRTVGLAPQLPELLAQGQVPTELEAEIRLALSVVGEKFVAFNEQTLADVGARFPGDSLERLASGLSGLVCGVRPSAHPLQRPGLLGFANLRANAWFEDAEFPWAAPVKDQWQAIWGEYEHVRRSGAEDFRPYLAGGSGQSVAGSSLGALAGSNDWSAYHLYRNGHRHEHECRQCPVTIGAVEQVLPRVRNQMPEVFFSRLVPNGHIVPHYGLMNVRLTVHLGLDIPSDSGLRVGDETRSWEPGGLLIFDDSFEHEAWNRGDRDRVVLIFEAWHPDLTAAEIAGIERVFELRRDWIESCQPT